MDNFNFEAEEIEGTLCGKGLMSERYDHLSDKLIRNITPKGKRYIKEGIENDPLMKKLFLEIIKKTANEFSPQRRKTFLEELKKEMLE